MSDVIPQIETAIRRDPARRGLLADSGIPLGLGELEAAAYSLAHQGRHSVILTGFFIPSADPPAAETDGPPGAVALAVVLRRLGQIATLVTDPFCGTALDAAARAAGLPVECVRTLSCAEELRRVISEANPAVSHLIAIERVGPGHTCETIRQRCGAEVEARFRTTVPAELWSRCLNMRGQPIEEWTVDYSALFETPPDGVVTVGLGDGGNELGLGKFDWTDLSARLVGVADPRILCRIAARHAIVAGTSNWAAYGLAAATAVAAGRPEAFEAVTSASQQRVLDAMIQEGPAVDGVTRRFEPTVDGLPLPTYLEPLEAIRRRLGLGSG